MSYAKISVCMATYNGEKYVLEQVKSILKQLSENDELIISDDSSQDSTVQIIESIGDHRIKLFPKQVYKNPIFNFENALRNSSGDIIFLSDQDDIWMPGKVSTMAPLIAMGHLVLSDCTLVDDKGEVVNPSYFSINRSGPGVWRNLFRTSSYMGCCLGFPRQLLNIALPFPRKIPMHDLWIGMIGEMHFRPIFVSQQLIYHRRHQSNASETGSKSTNSLLRKVGFRLRIIFPLITRSILKFF